MSSLRNVEKSSKRCAPVAPPPRPRGALPLRSLHARRASPPSSTTHGLLFAHSRPSWTLLILQASSTGPSPSLPHQIAPTTSRTTAELTTPPRPAAATLRAPGTRWERRGVSEVGRGVVTGGRGVGAVRLSLRQFRKSCTRNGLRREEQASEKEKRGAHVSGGQRGGREARVRRGATDYRGPFAGRAWTTAEGARPGTTWWDRSPTACYVACALREAATPR